MRFAVLIALSTLLAFGAEVFEPSSPFVRIAPEVPQLLVKWKTRKHAHTLAPRNRGQSGAPLNSLARFNAAGHDGQVQTRGRGITLRLPIAREVAEYKFLYQPPQLLALQKPPSA